MNNLEKLLHDNMSNYNIQPPEDFEQRLRKALVHQESGQTKKKNKPSKYFALASCILVIFFITYHYNTFAYYGKRLIGYESLMSQDIKNLNKAGKGQRIDRSIELDSGQVITLDAVMIDANQMLAFYRVNSPSKLENYPEVSISFKGFFKNYTMNSSAGEYISDNEAVYIASFDSPSIIEKNLTLSVEALSTAFEEVKSFDFEINRQEAMAPIIKKNISKVIVMDELSIVFDKIVASPTKTVVKGNIDSLLKFVSDSLSDSRINITDLNIQLFEDNKELPIQGSGLSTDIFGRKFEASFDSISPNISEIKIIVNSITALDKPMFSIDLSKINFPYKIKSENYYIELLGFTFDDDYVYLTIKTDIDVFVLDVNLYSNKKLLPFIETQTINNINSISNNQHTRIVKFQRNTDMKNLNLEIGTVKYKLVPKNNTIKLDVD